MVISVCSIFRPVPVTLLNIAAVFIVVAGGIDLRPTVIEPLVCTLLAFELYISVDVSQRKVIQRKNIWHKVGICGEWVAAEQQEY